MKSVTLSPFLFSAKGLRTGWVVMIYVALIVAGETLVVDPLGALLESTGLAGVRGASAQDWTSAASSVVKLIARIAMILLVTHLVLRWFMKGSLATIGFHPGQHMNSDLMIGVGLGFVVQIVAALSMWVMGWYSVVGLAWESNSLSALGPAWFYALFFCIETGVIEEVMFRGFLIRLVTDRYDLKKAVIASSMIFGIVHFGGFGGGFPWWASLISASAGGFVFAQAFLVHRSLWIPIGMHFAWHLAARTLGTVGVGGSEALCLVTEVQGPVLMISTRAGGAGVCELAGVGVVSLVLWQVRKRMPRQLEPLTIAARNGPDSP
ncbi:MAG: lysostaphin resistance A-like protein [Planctomycetota bacterium]|jgi:membrane protease YdiL (CAAX protease family)